MKDATHQPMHHAIFLSLAAYPRRRFTEAMNIADVFSASEPFIGKLKLDHVQLCPQNFGVLDHDTIDRLQQTYPATAFRLHANVRVLQDKCMSDLSSAHLFPTYWAQLAIVSRALQAPGYSAHAGLRSESTFHDIVDRAHRLADDFDCPVAIEGHYPTRGDVFLVSSWAEYRELFDSGVPYALDLSHLNIVACQTGVVERALTQEMLACERCIEVHLSGNDGLRDQHKPLSSAPWWWDLLSYINSKATVFSESVQTVNAP